MAVPKFPPADWNRALGELCARQPQGYEAWAPASVWVNRTYPTPDLGPPESDAFNERQTLWSRRLAVAYWVIIRHAERFRSAGLLIPAAPWFRPEDALCGALYERYGAAGPSSPLLVDRPLSEEDLALIIAKARLEQDDAES